MLAQPILTKTQQLYLTFTLALVLTLTWTTIASADSPGDLDITFGGTGVVTTSVSSGDDGGFSMAIQPDDKIVVAGVSNSDGNNDDFALVRYNNDGSRDTTFNNTGVVTTMIDTSWGYSTAIQPDGKIVVAGNSYRMVGSGFFDYAFAVARYHITGTLDTDFNNTGVVTTSVGDGFEVGLSVAIQPDGKIVVAGQREDPNGVDSEVVVVRYNITGTLDTDFNNTGIVTTPLGNSGGFDLVVQPDDKIVVAGFSDENLAVLRYTITGTLDTSFNGTGIVTTPIGAGGFGTGIALQPDGKIVVAGSGDGDFALARYHSNGSLDTDLNGTGIVTTAITSDSDLALDLALQPNGKIVVAGSSGNIFGEDGDITVARYHDDGRLDTTFGGAGVVAKSLSSTGEDAWGVAIQPDGKIVVAGFAYQDGKVHFAVVRFIGGELDQTYLPMILKNP